jgi:spermidine synthase
MASSRSSEFRSFPGELQVLARGRTPYNDIFVLQEGSQRALWFNADGDFFLQSRMDMDRPLSLVLVYSRMILASLLFCSRPRRVLCIGLGAGILPRCLSHWFPDLIIDVVEIDPKVVQFARRYFNFRESINCRVHVEDGRLFLKRRPSNGGYDIVFLDAFKSGSVPFHLKTREFYHEIMSALTPDGLLASNLYGKSNTLKPSDEKTFLSHFDQLYVFEDPAQVATVSVAARHPKRWSALKLRELAQGKDVPGELGLSLMEVTGFLKEKGFSGGGKVLQDDFPIQELTQASEIHNLQDLKRKRPYPIFPTG